MNFKEGLPIYLQIVKHIKEEIALGKLKADDKFPSIREIASEYKVNPNTVQKSTQLLEQEGIIYSKRGIGSFVAKDQDLIDDLKINLAKDYSKEYLINMKKIGIDKNDALIFLKELNDEY